MLLLAGLFYKDLIRFLIIWYLLTFLGHPVYSWPDFSFRFTDPRETFDTF